MLTLALDGCAVATFKLRAPSSAASVASGVTTVGGDERLDGQLCSSAADLTARAPRTRRDRHRKAGDGVAGLGARRERCPICAGWVGRARPKLGTHIIEQRREQGLGLELVSADIQTRPRTNDCFACSIGARRAARRKGAARALDRADVAWPVGVRRRLRTGSASSTTSCERD